MKRATPEQVTIDPRQPWASVSLCVSGFGGTLGPMRRILLDWFDFLGGRPGEVVYVDGGSDASTSRALSALLREGHIDRLELLTPDHWENHPQRCYIQEHQAGRLATLDYLCFVKLDTLSYRADRPLWLNDAFGLLDDPSVFAITNSHLVDPMQPCADHEGLLEGDFASLNFALMKRTAFRAAMASQVPELLDSAFKAPLPTDLGGDEGFERALVEWAWRAHCRSFGRRTLAWPESREWMIFHMNKSGSKLMRYRDSFRRFDGVEPYFDLPKALYRPPIRGLSKLGRSVEGSIRSLKKR